MTTEARILHNDDTMAIPSCPTNMCNLLIRMAERVYPATWLKNMVATTV